MSYRSNIHLPDSAFPMSTDSVLLASFASLRRGERVCDLGAGVGTLSMLLAERYPDCSYTGLELLDENVKISKGIIESNGFVNIRVLQHDLREPAPSGPPYDAAVSNPPYFPAGSGAEPKNPIRSKARSEDTLPLASLCKAAGGLLKYGGRFYLVHKPERLADLMTALRESGLEPKRMRFVKKNAGSPPSLLLMESRKGGKPGLQYESDLVLTDSNGEYSEEYKQIYGIGGSIE